MCFTRLCSVVPPRTHFRTDLSCQSGPTGGGLSVGFVYRFLLKGLTVQSSHFGEFSVF